jgi:hypothetical protein
VDAVDHLIRHFLFDDLHGLPSKILVIIEGRLLVACPPDGFEQGVTSEATTPLPLAVPTAVLAARAIGALAYLGLASR